ncbi:MAG: DUF3501 family protein [Gammaproteobacteria bacterium]|jgi:hypothetical protein|nr:DUF3501 family protein [Gammaproteobacteria bacterium]MBT3724976.1 DUF3501 family protein [Gammaproteobacteria bacterium]MBT4077922.1 DUF3501 family protein [Gammaproteobacteria bacterium]MBT4192771.1 DUF3501 family protein [Gammaproteobacteria bacterium]MBT4451913.1 DUF3501 family protein [Gammaproteobacteria bacterium]
MSQTHSLSRQDLWSLEVYAEKRPDFRTQVMKHKQDRKIALGPNSTLYFEDRLTIQYQIQEMLRIEKVFEAEGIEEELSVYNPMLPEGCNWKATYMIEYTDVEERSAQLEKMIGIEDLVWVQVEGYDKVWAIADEDLERTNDIKTSSVHFMRFELTKDMIDTLKKGKGLSMGVEHSAYSHSLELSDNSRESLINDLD